MITIYSAQGVKLLDLENIGTGSKGYYSLMQHDYVVLDFSLETPIDFGIGSYVDLTGQFDDALGGKLSKKYYVTEKQTPTYNTATGGYDYELRLNAYYWLWNNYVFKYIPEVAGNEASWSLTAALDVHLGVFLRNLASLGFTFNGQPYTYSIDETVENKSLVMTYDNQRLLDALFSMGAEDKWNCDVWVTENVIHFGRCELGDAVRIERGVNAQDITRSESKGTFATRIYAFGSTRNIPTNYRPVEEQAVVNGVVQKRLMLPEGTPYVDAYPDMSPTEVIEDVVVFDDIYPRRVGTLQNVTSRTETVENEDGTQSTYIYYRYKDSGLVFDKDYILEGQELQVTFQSGKLNGMTFGVIFNPDGKSPAEQLWEIVGNEDYGRFLPDDTIKPEDGDEYVLFGFDIQLVSDQYIPAAEQELLRKAQEYVNKTKVDDGTYTATLRSDWVFTDQVHRTFDVGQKITLVAPDFFTDDRVSRVIGWEMNLDIPYDSPVYTIGESAQYSRLTDIEEKVDTLTFKGQAYTGAGGSGVYVIRTVDKTPPSDSNVFSALRSRQEFLSKVREDTASAKITFLRGLDIGTFTQGAAGGTFRTLEDLTTYAEVDRLRVRVKAYFETLEIVNANSIGGKQIITPGGGVYLREVADRETVVDAETGETTENVWPYYRCRFLTEQDGRKIENRFKVGDLAISQSFNLKAGTSEGVTNHYYWREVVGVGEDYIDLSKSVCDTGSDAPMAEDTVCQLGNRSDKDRQGALVFSAVDVFSPSVTLYHGIDDFSLSGKDYVSYGVDKTTGNAFFRVYGEMYAGDRDQTSYMRYTPANGVEIRGRFLNQSGESYDSIIQSIQDAVNGNIETWFGEDEPTLSNAPAIDWTTDEERDSHLGDLYYTDGGVAYRFQVDGTGYVWRMLKDSDITKALAEAKAAKDAAETAQDTADAAKGRLDQWAADGVISPTEKQAIKDEIARIDADKANIESQYAKYGLGTPTAFDAAYTAYRSVLVTLTASTPENISIPSDFSTKQTYYYNERTSALGAIADASIKSVSDVSKQLADVQNTVNGLKTEVNGVKESVNGLRDFTDEAFADGIVDRNESAAIGSYVKTIETFANDAAESYAKVYGNELLSGTAKTELANAYKTFTDAKDELLSAISSAIADGVVDALEKASVNGKFDTFNTKYGDFIAYLNAANKAIQDAINDNALDALRKIGELDYLKAALKGFTTIEGGLIQSSTLALGYTTDDGYTVMAGTNGIYDASKLGGGIASWWGGAMFDRFAFTDDDMPENVAKGVIRMDGTGYLANGNLWWEADGTLHADPLSFFVGPDSVGDLLGMFQFVKNGSDIEYVIPQYPFQKLEIGDYIKIGNGRLYWDDEKKAFYVRHDDGVTPVGFYSTGWMSAKGANPDAGSLPAGATLLEELEDVTIDRPTSGQVLAWDGFRWKNMEMTGGLDESELADYLTNHGYAKKTDITLSLSGYATRDWVNQQGFITADDLPSLTGYATQSWVTQHLASYATTAAMNSALANKADKTVKISAGTGLAGGGDLSANRTLSLATVGTAGTYTKVTTDAYGRVTAGAALAASDIPALSWSKITSGKPTTLAGYGITDGVNSVTVTGSGNVVTTASISGNALTLTKGITALTAHQAIYALTLQGNGAAIATYNPKSAASTINLTATNLRLARGLQNPQTGRTQAFGGLYSYYTNGSAHDNAPATYTSVIGFGRDTDGATIEIAGSWVSGMGLWYRGLRYTDDNWWGWLRILDSSNYSSYAVPLSRKVTAGNGLTGGGALTADITLNVASANTGITVNADNIQLDTYYSLDADDLGDEEVDAIRRAKGYVPDEIMELVSSYE